MYFPELSNSGSFKDSNPHSSAAAAESFPISFASRCAAGRWTPTRSISSCEIETIGPATGGLSTAFFCNAKTKRSELFMAMHRGNRLL